MASVLVPEPLIPHVDQVILGQVLQGGQGMNIARQLSLSLGIPQSCPAFTVNMVCGSSLKATSLGRQAAALGEAGLVLAGGVEVMSRAPHFLEGFRWGKKLGNTALKDSILVDGLSDPLLGIHMGETAENIAAHFGITREEQDEFARQSQQRVADNRLQLSREIVPVDEMERDEHPREGTTREDLARLKPVFREGGTVTAGNSSGINDGAAMVLLAGAKTVDKLKLKPRARIVADTTVGCDPAQMGLGPVGAIRKVLAMADWRMDQVDLFEINEAFAAQILGVSRELRLDPAAINRRGGAIALGHPIGASGARVLVTLLHQMEDEQKKQGVASLCIGGGMGAAMALELI